MLLEKRRQLSNSPPVIIDVIYLCAQHIDAEGKKGTSGGCPLSTSKRKVCFAWRRFSIFLFSPVRRQCRLVDHDLVHLIRHVSTETRTPLSLFGRRDMANNPHVMKCSDIGRYNIGTIFDTRWGGSFESYISISRCVTRHTSVT